jgi:hypothetical protein
MTNIGQWWGAFYSPINLDWLGKNGLKRPVNENMYFKNATFFGTDFVLIATFETDFDTFY